MTPIAKTFLTLAALTVGFPLFAVAEEPDSTARALDNVTVTARPTPVRLASATPVQTIGVNTIERLGIQNMADAVRRFAGTTVRDYGGIGGLKTVSVRNMGAAHTGVSYDGVPVSNCQGGQIDIGRFSLDNISTISLAVGNNDELLQPATLFASAAVLGITTMQPPSSQDRRNSFRIGMKGGSFGFVNPSVRWWGHPSSSTVVALDGDFMRADGNYPFTLENGTESSRERRNNSAITSWHGEGNFTYTRSVATSITAKAYYYYSRRGLPGSVTLYNPQSNEQLWDRNAFLQTRWRSRISPQWSVQAVAKYNYGWNRDRQWSPQFTGGMYESVHRQDEYYLSATAVYRPVEEATVALASDAAINTLESNLSFCPLPRRFTSLTSLTARYSRGGLTANATLLATVVTEHVKYGEAPDNVRRLNPSASVSIKPWSEHEIYVRTLYKSSFRMPSFNDLYYERSGNRTLRPERANEWDLGITWGLRPGGTWQYVSFTADGYFNDVRDKIVAFPGPYVWKTVNYGKVRAYGLDVNAAAAVGLPFSCELTVSAAYSLQRSVNLADPTSKEYHGQVPYTPLHSGNAACSVTTPWLTVGYSAVAVGKRYYLAQNIPANEIKAYVEQTVTAGRSLNLGTVSLDLRAELVNLANTQYEVIRYYPMPGRSWRVVAHIDF